MGITVYIGPDSESRREMLFGSLHGRARLLLVARTPGLAHNLARTTAHDLAHRDWDCAQPHTPVYAWRRLLEDLWLSHGDGRAIIDDATRASLVSHTIEARGPVGDDRPADLLDYPGGRRLLTDLLRSYKPEDIASAAGAEGPYRALLRATATCADAERAAGFIELPEVVQLLAASPLPCPPDVALIGFSSLSADEVGLISALASAGSDIAIELPATSAGQHLGALGPTLGQIESLGGVTVLVAGDEGRIGWQVAEGARSAAPTLLRSESLATGALTCSRGDGRQSEVVLVVDRVLDELRSGTKPDQIAVLLRDGKGIVPALVTELERRGVPYAINMSVPLRSTGLGAAFIELLRLVVMLGSPGSSSGARSTEGTHLLGSFLASAYSGMANQDAARIDAGARGFGRAPEAVIRDIATDRSGRPGFGRRSAIGQISAQCRRWGSGESDDRDARGWKLISDELLANANLVERGSWWSTRRDECAHAAIADVIASMVEMQVEVTPEELLEQCLEADVAVGPSPHSFGRVTIGSPGAVLGRTFAAIVVPELAGTGGFDLASARGVDAVAQHEGLPQRANPAQRREIEDFSSLASATKSVHLVWREATEGGEETVRSELLENVISALGAHADLLSRMASAAIVNVGDEMSEQGWDAIAEEWGAEGYQHSVVLATLELARAVKVASASDADVAASRSHASPERTTQYAAPSHSAPCIEPRGAEAITYPEGYWDDRVLSPSAIEAYVRCPYRWFLGSALRTHAIDDEFDPSAQGTAIHRVLELFYVKWVRELGRQTVDPDSLDEARRVFDEVVAGVVDELADSNSMRAIADPTARLQAEQLLEKAWAVIVRDARGKIVSSKTRTFRPTFFEWRFGRGPRAERDGGELREPDVFPDPVVIGGVPIAGTIDRIDTCEDPETGDTYLAIVDYKGRLSGVTNGLGMLERAQIQVPLYAAIAQRALRGVVAFGGYAPYRGELTKHFCSKSLSGVSTGLSDEDFERGLERVEELVAHAAAAMRAGEITPLDDPEKAQYAACGYCSNQWCPQYPAGEGYR